MNKSKVIALLMFISLAHANANGGDFFNELSSSWNNNEDIGIPFFGIVKDENNKVISRAMVSASINDNTIVILSDNLGHYKIPGLGKEVDSKKVEINCSKAGYKLLSVDKRYIRSIPNAPVEVNCKMKKI
jgi:hypothetical protein